KDQRGGVLVAELFQHGATKRRLARADFTRQLDKPFALANTVEQMIERFPVFRAVKKKARVGRDGKRGLRQPVIFQIHVVSLAKTVPEGRKSFFARSLAAVKTMLVSDR